MTPAQIDSAVRACLVAHNGRPVSQGYLAMSVLASSWEDWQQDGETTMRRRVKESIGRLCASGLPVVSTSYGPHRGYAIATTPAVARQIAAESELQSAHQDLAAAREALEKIAEDGYRRGWLACRKIILRRLHIMATEEWDHIDSAAQALQSAHHSISEISAYSKGVGDAKARARAVLAGRGP
jgi:hypothetical protein